MFPETQQYIWFKCQMYRRFWPILASFSSWGSYKRWSSINSGDLWDCRIASNIPKLKQRAKQMYLAVSGVDFTFFDLFDLFDSFWGWVFSGFLWLFQMAENRKSGSLQDTAEVDQEWRSSNLHLKVSETSRRVAWPMGPHIDPTGDPKRRNSAKSGWWILNMNE